MESQDSGDICGWRCCVPPQSDGKVVEEGMALDEDDIEDGDVVLLSDGFPNGLASFMHKEPVCAI